MTKQSLRQMGNPMKPKILALAVGVLALCACSSTGGSRASNEETINATVTRSVFGPDRIELSINGQTYRGEWKTQPPSKEQAEGAGYRHRQHMHQVTNTLTADDGSEVQCHWQTHLYAAEGRCLSANREFSLSLQRDW